MKPPTGSVKRRGNRWLARITWSDPSNRARRHTRKRYVKTKNAGGDQIASWVRELDANGTIRPANSAEAIDDKEEKSFADLAAFYRERYAVEPVYNEQGEKISGLRSWRTVRGHITKLEAALASSPLSEIEWDDLDEIRLDILDDDLTLATTNRVLATARRMFKIARQKKWMKHNPFEEGDPLIDTGREKPRIRILTKAEELTMLAQCTDAKNRAHLRIILIAAVESGMRWGELRRLQKWQGVKDESGRELPYVDWKQDLIHVTAFHTKTMTERFVPLTKRLKTALRKWIATTSPKQSYAFGRIGDVKTAFRGAKKDAKISGLRMHDYRHTFATRAIARGVPLPLLSRIMGHQSIETTMIYVNLHKEAAQEVGKQLNRVTAAKRGKRKETYTSEEKVN